MRKRFTQSGLQTVIVGATIEIGSAQASRLLFVLHWLARRRILEGTLRGGLDRVAEALAVGGPLRLGAPAEALEPERGGALAVAVGGTDAGRVGADAVLLAVPAPATLRLAGSQLAPAERDGLAAIRYAPAIVLHAALARPLVGVVTRVRVPRVEGGPLAVAHLEPAGAAGRAPADRASASLLASADFAVTHLDAPDDVVAKALLGALERLYPGAADAVDFVLLRRHREAWPRFEVGAFRRVARLRGVGADRRAAGRRLYLAGDHLALPTLEGAALSGAPVNGTRSAVE